MNFQLPPDAAGDSGPDPQPSRQPPRATAAASLRPSESAARLEGILLGHWRAVRLLIGWSWPALVLVVLGGAWWLRARPGDGDLPNLAVMLLLAAGFGSLLQAGLRIELGRRLHRSLEQLTLTAIGYRTGSASVLTTSTLATGRGKQRLALAAGPTLALLAAGLGAAAAAAVVAPADAAWTFWGSTSLAGEGGVAAVLRVAAWVWLTQAALMGLPIPGSAGRQILWGLVEQWPLLQRPLLRKTQHSAPPARRPSPPPADTRSPELLGRRVDRLQGVIAIGLAAAAAWQWQQETGPLDSLAGSLSPYLPVWPFLLALAILVWSGRGGTAAERSQEEAVWTGEPDASVAPSDEEGSAPLRWSVRAKAKRRQLSWWGRWRIRRVQRAEREEAVDAMRLDAVLERLHRDGFEALSADDRTILRRVSQRLRESRDKLS